MNGFVYKWTNTVNGRWYIGSHKGTIDDGYRHSSKVLEAAEYKYGQDKFVREVLYAGDYDADNIRLVEGEYLSKYGAAKNPESYNQTNIIGTDCHSDEANRKRSETLTGRKLSEEHCRNLARFGNTNGAANKGSKRSTETKKKMSLKKLGNTYGQANKGKAWSPARRAAYEKNTAEIVQDFPT